MATTDRSKKRTFLKRIAPKWLLNILGDGDAPPPRPIRPK